jgi:hypothetical protein
MLKSAQRIDIMANSANLTLDQALELSANDRAHIAEMLLFSLDSPDPKNEVYGLMKRIHI